MHIIELQHTKKNVIFKIVHKIDLDHTFMDDEDEMVEI